MPNDDDIDGIALLIGLGIIAVVGVGLLHILAAIDDYEPGETINESQASQLAAAYKLPPSKPQIRGCTHGDDTELCRECGKCISCNGGIGDSKNRWCLYCEHWWQNYNY
jgi:hypothetical protein